MSDSYEQGYIDGESNREADYIFLTTELDLPFDADDMRPMDTIKKMEQIIESLQTRVDELEEKAASFEGSFNAALKDVQRLDAALAEIKALDIINSEILDPIIEKARAGE